MKIEFIILYSCVLLYLLSLLFFYLFADKFIFQSSKLPKDYTFQFDKGYEEIEFISQDSIVLHGLFFPTNRQNPKGAVLYFHGNRGHLQKWGAISDDFTGRGYNLYMMDYRSYGKSGGVPSEAKLYQDAFDFYNWVKEKDTSEKLIIYGRSLGSAIASKLSKEVKADKLILETPFAEIKDVLKQYMPLSQWILKSRYDFSNIDHLEDQENEVFIFHGTKDLTVPSKSALKLKSYVSNHDHFVLVRGANHHNIRKFDIYQDKMNELLN